MGFHVPFSLPTLVACGMDPTRWKSHHDQFSINEPNSFKLIGDSNGTIKMATTRHIGNFLIIITEYITLIDDMLVV